MTPPVVNSNVEETVFVTLLKHGIIPDWLKEKLDALELHDRAGEDEGPNEDKTVTADAIPTAPEHHAGSSSINEGGSPTSSDGAAAVPLARSGTVEGEKAKSDSPEAAHPSGSGPPESVKVTQNPGHVGLKRGRACDDDEGLKADENSTNWERARHGSSQLGQTVGVNYEGGFLGPDSGFSLEDSAPRSSSSAPTAVTAPPTVNAISKHGLTLPVSSISRANDIALPMAALQPHAAAQRSITMSLSERGKDMLVRKSPPNISPVTNSAPIDTQRLAAGVATLASPLVNAHHVRTLAALPAAHISDAHAESRCVHPESPATESKPVASTSAGMAAPISSASVPQGTAAGETSTAPKLKRTRAAARDKIHTLKPPAMPALQTPPGDTRRELIARMHQYNCVTRKADDEGIICLWVPDVSTMGGQEQPQPCLLLCAGGQAFKDHCATVHGVQKSKYGSGKNGDANANMKVVCRWDSCSAEPMNKENLMRHLEHDEMHGRRKRSN